MYPLGGEFLLNCSITEVKTGPSIGDIKWYGFLSELLLSIYFYLRKWIILAVSAWALREVLSQISGSLDILM